MDRELYLRKKYKYLFRIKFGMAILINTYIRLKIRVVWGGKGFVILKNLLKIRLTL